MGQRPIKTKFGKFRNPIKFHLVLKLCVNKTLRFGSLVFLNKHTQKVFDPLMHNVPKWSGHTSKILQQMLQDF